MATFGESTLRAAIDAGMKVKASAPSPEAPSMAKALDLYIAKVRRGEEVAEVEVKADNNPAEVIKMPASWVTRKLEIYFNLELAAGHHTVQLRWLNPIKEATLNVYDALLQDKE